MEIIYRTIKFDDDNEVRGVANMDMRIPTFAVNKPMLKLNQAMGFEIISHRLQKKLD